MLRVGYYLINVLNRYKLIIIVVIFTKYRIYVPNVNHCFMGIIKTEVLCFFHFQFESKLLHSKDDYQCVYTVCI